MSSVKVSAKSWWRNKTLVPARAAGRGAERYSQVFDELTVDVLHVSPGGELIISDAPAFTLYRSKWRSGSCTTGRGVR